MTLVRRLALGISSRVVRWASPGCKEWAEGLAREAAVIESDWAALRWAMSSIPVLFDRRHLVPRTLQDVPALAQKLRASSNYLDGNPAWIWSVPSGLWAGMMGSRMLRAANPMERVGCALAMTGWIVSGIVTYVDRSRRKQSLESPAGDWTIFFPGDIGAWVLYYRSELERSLERLRSPLIWVNLVAIFLVLIGWGIVGEDFSVSAAFAVPIVVSVVPWIFYLRKRIQWRLDRLNALVAEWQ